MTKLIFTLCVLLLACTVTWRRADHAAAVDPDAPGALGWAFASVVLLLCAVIAFAYLLVEVWHAWNA